MKPYALGLDIGGTRMKLGAVRLRDGTIGPVSVVDTCRDSETEFFSRIQQAAEENLARAGVALDQLEGVGVSVGTYVFSDGCIDGMSCFVPFLTEGYPLVPRLEQTLQLPVRADNDVRLIGLAESLYGEGRGFRKTLTITLGSGVGIGLCEDGRPYGTEAFCHLAGHILVRENRIEALDRQICYCGQQGCLEATCSGTSLEKYIKAKLGPEIDNQTFFQLAGSGDPAAVSCLEWYLDMLGRGLNQYIYLYSPDVIILGGGISKSLAAYEAQLTRRITAKAHSRQQTRIRFSQLKEASGVLGAALLFVG